MNGHPRLAICFPAMAQRYALLWLLSQSASAGNPGPHIGNVIDELIVTATREEQALGSHGGNLATLDQDTLALTAHTHIQESLNRIAGVNFHRNSGQEYLPAIRSPVLSGPGACGSVLLLENGVPLRPAGFCNINELFEANSEQAARIEVIRGPGTALQGANALHGVVNVLGPATPGQPATLSLEGGPHDYIRSRMRWSADGFAISANATADSGYRDGAGFTQQKFSAAHGFENEVLNLSSALTAVNLEQDTAGFVSGRNAYRDTRLSRANPTPGAYRNARALRLSTRADLNNGWAFTPYARYSSMAFTQHFLPGQPLERNGQHSVGLLSQKTLAIGEQLRLIAGIDLEYADAWLKEDQTGPVAGSLFLVETIPPGKHYDYQVNSRLAAPFVHGERSLGPRWSVTAGGRHEWITYVYDNRMGDGRTRADGTLCGFGGCRFNRPADRTDHFGNFSGKLGLNYRIPRRQFYLNLSQGYRPPQMTEVYRLQGQQSSTDLDPEQATSIELGWRGKHGPLGYDLALFTMEKEDVIFRDRDQFTINGGKTRHQGFEYRIDYRLNNQWTLAMAGTLARHRYANDMEAINLPIKDNDIDTAPRHFGSAQLTWEATETVTAELEWVMMSRYYLDPENEHRYGGHNLIHLRTRWEFSPTLTLSLRTLNLTGRKYAERADFTGTGGYRYFPGEPRSLYGGIEYRFH